MTIENLDKIIKETFEDKLVTNVETVWELSNDEKFYKLVISLHGVDSEDTIIVHTKFIFKFNKDKRETIENSFIYLYDINCQYKSIEFDDNNLSDKMLDIFYSNKFGTDIKSLSDFLSNPVEELNVELNRMNIDKFSIFEVKYNPKYKIVPCKLINFDFDINVNNIYTFKTSISKVDKEDYRVSTQMKEFNEEDTINNLENIVDVISGQLINIMKKLV